ncbi:ATP-binding cassette domain-containing protein [Desulfitobacterium sp.]
MPCRFLHPFSTVDGGSSTILFGENGTGKSTMLKVIT